MIKIIITLILLTEKVMAQGTTGGTSSSSGSTVTASTGGSYSSVGEYIASLITQFAYPLAYSLALIIIIYSGILYITSGGNPDNISKAKDLLTGVVLGILTLFLIGYVLNLLIGV